MFEQNNYEGFSSNIVGVFIDVDADGELKPFIISEDQYVNAVEVLYGTEFECVGSLLGFDGIKFKPSDRYSEKYRTAEHILETMCSSEGIVGILFLDEDVPEYDSVYIFISDIEFFNAWYTLNGEKVILTGDDVMSGCYYDEEAVEYKERYEGL